LQVASELAAVSDRITILQVSTGQVLAQVPDHHAAADLARDVGLPRLVRDHQLAGFVHGIRVVVWHPAPAHPWPQAWPAAQTHYIWPARATTVADQPHEQTHDRRRS
jgi:hypothetical protein